MSGENNILKGPNVKNGIGKMFEKEELQEIDWATAQKGAKISIWVDTYNSL